MSYSLSFNNSQSGREGVREGGRESVSHIHSHRSQTQRVWDKKKSNKFCCLFVCLLIVLGWHPLCHRKTLEPWPTGGKCPVGSRGSPYSQRGHIRWPSLPPWQRDSTYSPLRSDKPTRLTRVGPDLIRYRRPHIAAMHTTRCTVSDMPRLRIMGKNPLPYRLLITLSPSKGSLSPRSRRNQVLRQLCIYACMGGLTSNSYVLHHLQALFMKEREMRHKHSKQKQPQSSRGRILTQILSRPMPTLSNVCSKNESLWHCNWFIEIFK